MEEVFSEVREYLTKKFNIGQDTGRKEYPEQVAKDMRTAMTIDGERLFDRAEWLSKTQIQGFFSRLSARIKKGNQKRIESEDNDDTDREEDDDEDLLEEYACDLDEHSLRETADAVQGKIGLAHPIIYDVYNLCTLAREGKLPTLRLRCLANVFTF